MSVQPARVLRLATIGWGLGDLAMGRQRAALAWLSAEVILLVGVVATTLLFAETSWYLLPFLLGMGFIGLWTAQAVLAYRRAQRLQGAIAPATSHSPAATVAWLTLPLLVWGTGFWLTAAGAANPAAVVDRFVTRWGEEAAGVADAYRGIATDPAALAAAASAGLQHLDELCAAGALADDCAAATENLLRDVRVRVSQPSDDAATAVGEVVRYERRGSTFLGLFDTSELVAVATDRVLRLELEARDAGWGAVRWVIVNATAL